MSSTVFSGACDTGRHEGSAWLALLSVLQITWLPKAVLRVDGVAFLYEFGYIDADILVNIFD